MARATPRELLQGWADTQREFNSQGDGRAWSRSWAPVDALLAEPTRPLVFWDGLEARGFEVQRYEASGLLRRPSPFASGRLYLHFCDPLSQTLPALLGAVTGRVLGTASASIRSVAVPGEGGEAEGSFPGILKFSAPWLGAERVVDAREIEIIEAFNVYLEAHGAEIQRYLMPDTAAIQVRMGESSTAVLHRPLPPDVARPHIRAEAFLSGVVLADPAFWRSEASRSVSELIPGAETADKARWIAAQLAPQLARLLTFGLEHGFIPGVVHLQNVNVFFFRDGDGRPSAEIKYQDFYTYMADPLLAFAVSPERSAASPRLPPGQIDAESLLGRRSRPSLGVRRAVEVGFDRWMNALSRLGGPAVRESFFSAFASELARYASAHGLPTDLVAQSSSKVSRLPVRDGAPGLGDRVSAFRDAVVATKIRERLRGERWTPLFEPRPIDFSTTPPRRPLYTGAKFDDIVGVLTNSENHARIIGTASTSVMTPGVAESLQRDSPFLRGLLSSYAIHQVGDCLVFTGSSFEDVMMVRLTADETQRLKG